MYYQVTLGANGSQAWVASSEALVISSDIFLNIALRYLHRHRAERSTPWTDLEGELGG